MNARAFEGLDWTELEAHDKALDLAGSALSYARAGRRFDINRGARQIGITQAHVPHVVKSQAGIVARFFAS